MKPPRDLGSYGLIAAVLGLGGMILLAVVIYLQSQGQPWIDASIQPQP